MDEHQRSSLQMQSEQCVLRRLCLKRTGRPGILSLMDGALQSGLSQLRTLFPSPISLELSFLVSLFGADLAPRLRAAWAIEAFFDVIF